jgi:5-methyltetrahydrofolate--homocysteine methyltransferase
MFILLPITDRGIPETAGQRTRNIRDIFARASRLGFTRDDVVVDGLVMAASSSPGAPAETLKTVSWCSEVFRVRTVLGLSNVSFGLPERRWINAAFMAQAVSRGLTLAIANPASEELMAVALAGDVLAGRDPGASAYIRRVSPQAKPQAQPPGGEEAGPSEKVYRSVLEGNRDAIEGLLAAALASGVQASALVNETMIPAITKVGDLYEKREYFLPQLIASAEAMKKGFDYLEPRLKAGTGEGLKGHTILLATVKGDIHDIGKNIVALMLRNHGFRVIDLGKDVDAAEIVRQVRRHKPVLVGLSALMTTTMGSMKEVIELARKEGIECRFLAGGAVVTARYAESIGAEYAKDGVDAVRVVKKTS